MRNFLKIFLRSLGTYLGVGGGLTQPLVIVGFPRLVILITYGIKYFTMEAVSLVCVLALNLTSSTMWCTNSKAALHPSQPSHAVSLLCVLVKGRSFVILLSLRWATLLLGCLYQSKHRMQGGGGEIIIHPAPPLYFMKTCALASFNNSPIAAHSFMKSRMQSLVVSSR